MSMVFKNILVYSLVGALLILPHYVLHAQEIQVSEDIQLTLSPKYPGPNELVHISARSFSFNMDTTKIEWRVNNVVVKTGKGETEITVTTGAIGKPTTITVSANPPTTTSYKQTLTIWPSAVDILWHVNTYIPPTYRGKALPVRGSTVTLIAMPSLAAKAGYYNPKTLYYEWRVNDTLFIPQSGRRKQLFTLPITLSSNIPQTISVTVRDEDKTVTQQKEVTINVREPELYFYELHPLQGPRTERAILNQFTIAPDSEVQLLAVPYYASQPPAALDFGWKVENIDIARGEGRADVLTYHAEQGSRAQQIVSLTILNPFNILERIQESFRIYVE